MVVVGVVRAVVRRVRRAVAVTIRFRSDKIADTVAIGIVAVIGRIEATRRAIITAIVIGVGTDGGIVRVAIAGIAATIGIGGWMGTATWVGPETLETNLGLGSTTAMSELLVFYGSVVGVFVLVVLATVPLGQIAGAYMRDAPALEAYTANGAYVMHQEEETGTITVGKAADLVVLERNLFEVLPEEIGEVRILETLVGGRTVFSAP